MTDFRTKLALPPFPCKISHRELVFSMGSCFAEHMSNRLSALKFSTLLNPSGILYNPVSIAKTLEKVLKKTVFAEKELFQHQGLWHSFDHHGSISHPEKAKITANIQNTYHAAHIFLKRSDRILITLGTAHAFVYKKTGEIVANCHKLPGQEFDRHRLSVSTIVESLAPVFANLKKRKPELEIIVTVSPVRHIRDGLVKNQRSKAALLLALDELCREFSHVHYFPAYELQMDDLRDYRFYKKDMIHPNQQAIDYIWSYFSEAFFTEETAQLTAAIEKIRQAAQHQAFHPASAEHQEFLKKQLGAIEKVEKVHSYLDFSEERAIFLGQLN